jgi:hypothetical protein
MRRAVTGAPHLAPLRPGPQAEERTPLGLYAVVFSALPEGRGPWRASAVTAVILWPDAEST